MVSSATSERENSTSPIGYVAMSHFDAAFAQLGAWYGNASLLLDAVVAATPDSAPVRCWPHHFDIATLQILDGGRTVGAGFLGGDGQYREPYWYVTPYPYPNDRSSYPPLPRGGFWNTEGWFGAVLLGDHARDEAAEFLDAASGHFAPLTPNPSPR